MGDFASALQSQISSTLMGSPSEPSSAPTTTETPSSPASTPASTPASPTAPTPTETPSSPIADDEEFQFPSDSETPPADAPTETTPPEAQPTTEDPTNWKPEDIDKMLPQQVIDKLLQTNKGRGIYQSYKTMRELERPLEEGGLGYRPSIEQIRGMAQDSSDMQIMAHEFQNAQANPAFAENWTRQWFQVGPDGRPNPSAMAVAQQLAGTLDKHSPDLYRAVAVPVVTNYIEERYRAAEQEQDPEQRVVLFNVARILEADIKGQARDIPEEMWKHGKPATPPVDPKAAEVQRGLQQIDEFKREQAQAAHQHFVSTMNGEIGRAVNTDIQAALKPLADVYKGADGKPTRAYTALEKQFHSEVVQRVNQNPAQLRNYTIARDRARMSRDPGDIKNAARAWQAAARPIIKQLRTPYLKDALDRKVSESEQRHATLSEASQKRGSTSVGQPTEKSVAPTLTRQPGESQEEFVRRRVDSVMNVA